MDKLVLFDIDGTLLYGTSSFQRQRFTYAMEKVYGKSAPVNWERHEGQTDTTVFLETLRTIGFTREEIIPRLPEAFEATYEHFALNVTQNYSQNILPGAAEILTALKPQVHLGVLTGNYEKTAWHKLEMVGLRDFFDFGLFGHEAEDRIGLAKLVQQKAKKNFNQNFLPKQIFLIGDTPKDIACARAIKANIIAVSTGKYSKEELLLQKPDLLVESLKDPKIITFIRKEHL